jgi:MraZ protein
VSPDATTFYGTFTPRLDEKGRLTLPARFRTRLERGVVLTRGQENCIYGWTPDDFSVFSDRMRQLSFTDSGARKFVRMFFSGMSEEMPDKQGRIPIPSVLRTWASLDRECTVVGVMDRIEIWDSARWDEFEANHEESFSEMTEDVMPGIF